MTFPQKDREKKWVMNTRYIIKILQRYLLLLSSFFGVVFRRFLVFFITFESPSNENIIVIRAWRSYIKI